MERRERQIVLADRLCQRGHERVVGGFTAADGVQTRAQGLQPRQSLRWRYVALVGDVVRRAGEGVNVAHSRAQTPRQQDGGHGEVLVMPGVDEAAGRRRKVETKHADGSPLRALAADTDSAPILHLDV